jgi:hypothetical protein
MEIRAVCPFNKLAFIPKWILFTETGIELQCDWQRCPDSDRCNRSGLSIRVISKGEAQETTVTSERDKRDA